MTITTKLNRPRRRTLLPQSLRWRLPLSYAGIALLATVALGLLLLVMLRVYFQSSQENYLDTNARAISARLAPTLLEQAGPSSVQAQVEGFAFLLQRRVRLLSPSRGVLADSGSPSDLTIDLVPRSAAEEQRIASIVVKRRPPGEAAPVASEAPEAAPPAPPAPPALPVPPIPPADASAAAQAEYQARMRQYEAQVAAIQQRFEAEEEAYNRALEARFGLPIGSTLYGFNVNPEVAESSPQSDMVREAIVIEPATARPLGYVELSEGPTYGGEIVGRVAVAWMLATIFATLLAAAVGWVVSRRMTAPLRALTDVTARMASGDLAARAEVRRFDELGTLSGSFNQMAGRVEEIVATLRRFVADAAHELNTPLTALRANLDLALEDAEPAARAHFVELARVDVDRLEGLANDLLDLSRVEAAPEPGHLPSFDMCALAGELSETYGTQAEQAGVSFRLELRAEKLAIRGDSGQVRRAIGNLVENAIKFTPAGGSVTLRVSSEFEVLSSELASLDRLARDSKLKTQNSKLKTQNWLVVEVADTGIGITPEDLPQIFNRFHRGRNAASYPGSGLGLAIVQAIVQRHGGNVAVASSPAGTTFTLRWPSVERVEQ
jgi:two-component system sensor histidine kinase BaeS